MADSCVFLPKKGRGTFIKLKQNFGYDKAAVIFNNVRNKQFVEYHKNTLTFDSEGIPTYESIINNKAIQRYLKYDDILKAINKDQPHLEDTINNVEYLITKIIEFNNNKDNNSFIAYVDYDDDKNLTIKVVERNEKSQKIADYQVRIQQLNRQVSTILAKQGITMSELSKIEVAAGRVGLTNFNHAKDIATQFAGLMAVANNFEGYKAISEEFSHFIVGVYRNTPLIQRSINLLKNETTTREVLGEQYDNVFNYYNGNIDLVAEEAVGHILRDRIVNRDNSKEYKIPILKRAINYIINLFKGLNPAKYIDTINSIENQLDTLGKQVMDEQVKLTKEDIVNSQRDATFNALSEKAKVQLNVLNKSIRNLTKSALLQQNLDIEKDEEVSTQQQYKDFIERLRKSLHKSIKKEETMEAVYQFLQQAKQNADFLYKSLSRIPQLTQGDKFKVLRNTLWSIQAYDTIIEDLRSVLTEDFLTDEGINSQKFISSSIPPKSLEDVESPNGTEQIDTSEISIEDVANAIVNKSREFRVSDDKKYYINTRTGHKYLRVTSVIKADEFGEGLDGGITEDNPWYTPSTHIGTGMDEVVRDFISGRIIKNDKGVWVVNNKAANLVYPNIKYDKLAAFLEELHEFKQEREKKGLTFLTREVVANGTVNVLDGEGISHRVRVAGTLDLLAYDSNGNWYVYDMKTFRSNINSNKLQKYERQVTLYKTLLEEQYGIKVNGLSIIPIKVNYPNPEKGHNYSVSDDKPAEYNGAESDQLIVDGYKYKGLAPKLENIIKASVRPVDISYEKLTGDSTGGLGESKSSVLKAIDAVGRARSQMQSRFNEIALKEFIEFLKPFIGENIKLKDDEGVWREFSIAKVIKYAPHDVSLMNKLFTSMADNPDPLLQMLQRVYKKTKAQKRDKVIQKSTEIKALGKKFEQLGITDYDWMYEEDKDHYIIHYTTDDGKVIDYNLSDYNKALAEFTKELDDKYGSNPEILSKNYNLKNKELKQWIDSNTQKVTINGVQKSIPLMSRYPSRYSDLTTTQRDFYNQFMQIKTELDEIIGFNKTHPTNTIKIRKSGIERAKNILSGRGITEFINSVKESVSKSFDDTNNYKDTNTLKGFNGEEIMKLPLYYLHSYGDNSDVSTDAIGTLIAYTDMVYNYEAMSSIVNQLEVGKQVIIDNRKIQGTRGNSKLKEKFRYGKKVYEDDITVDIKSSQFLDAINQFLESKIYGRYLTDAGNLGNTGIDKQKAAGWLLKLGSSVQLGLNNLAHTANILTGINMQNIEAVASEFFNAGELFKADGVFTKELMDYIGDIGQRVPDSKLALFDEFFDVRQNFSSKIKEVSFLNKTILGNIFGPRLQFLGQDAGDFWLYNRTAIAMALRYKVLIDGQESTLWDALDVKPVDESDPSLGKKLVLKDNVTDLEGNPLTKESLYDFGDKVAYVNQKMFGIYNEEDSINARRLLWGRFVMQYRDFIPTAIRYRWGTKTTNLEKGDMVEGFYITTGKFFYEVYKELKGGNANLSQVWNQLEDYQKANIRRAITEVSIWIGIIALGHLLHGGDDDKRKRSWFRRFMEYAATREKTEIGAMTPFGTIPEGIKIIKSPVANISIMEDLYALTDLLWPPNYTNEIESGNYKGHSTAYRSFINSPLSLWYKNIRRTLYPEESEKYYNQ